MRGDQMRSDLVKAFYELRDYVLTNPKVLIGGVVLVFVSIVYVFSKLGDEEKRVYKSTTQPDFQNGRVIKSRTTEYYKKKDKHYNQLARSLKKENADLKNKLDEIEKLIKEMNQESSSIKENAEKTAQEEKSNESSQINQSSQVLDALVQIPSIPLAAPPLLETPKLSDLKKERSVPRGLPRRKQRSKKATRRGPETVSFPVKKGKPKEELGPVLAAGSFVKGTILTGVDASTTNPYPSLIALDHAYVSPNNFKVDLSNCFMIMKTQADLSSERVQMQPQKISCIAKHGKFFEKKVNGYVADGYDNRFAMRGKVISNRKKEVFMGFLSSIVEGIGKAVQMAQTTQTTNALGGSQSVVTGDKMKFIGAGAAADSAGLITRWYLNHAKQLLPVIRVGAGENVWVVMTDSFNLPKDFFNRIKKERSNEMPVGVLNRVVR